LDQGNKNQKREKLYLHQKENWNTHLDKRNRELGKLKRYWPLKESYWLVRRRKKGTGNNN